MLYRVLRGTYTQGKRVFRPGDLIELTEAESVAWGPGCFEPVAPEPHPADDTDDDSDDEGW